jgi:thioesterase domain-containing protein
MPTTTTKPTIVIVPGSFSAYGAYDSFVALIRAQGFPVLAVQLPSTQKRMPREPATLQEDASHVRGVVEKLIEEGEGTEVVVLAHSYGGTVATEALAGLEAKDGKGVKRIVYLAAIAPRVGETQLKAMGLETSPFPEPIVSNFFFPPTLNVLR